MKNLSRIFLRIGAILAIVCGAIFVALTVMFAIFASPAFKDALMEGFKNGTAHSSYEGSIEDQTFAVQIMFLIMAISFGITGALEIASAVISFKAISKPSENVLVLAIVFGALSGTTFPIAGGVVGLIAEGKEKRRAEKLANE